MILALLACAAGPNDATLVDELRVVAVLAEPPEAAPGASVAIETVVSDPVQGGYELLRWSCTSLGPECLEAGGEEAWQGITRDEPDGEVLISPALAELAGEEPLPIVFHWVLACEPGLCPIFDQLDAGEDQAVREALARPGTMLETLPMQGVSLALRTLRVSTREDPQPNPTLSCEGATEASPGGSIDFRCAVEGRFTGESGLWGYTSSGGWGGDSVALAEGDTVADYTWFAPEEPGRVQLWVVAVDGEGGVGLWEGEVSVE